MWFFFPEFLHVEVITTPTRSIAIETLFYITMPLFNFNPRDWDGPYMTKAISRKRGLVSKIRKKVDPKEATAKQAFVNRGNARQETKSLLRKPDRESKIIINVANENKGRKKMTKHSSGPDFPIQTSKKVKQGKMLERSQVVQSTKQRAQTIQRTRA